MKTLSAFISAVALSLASSSLLAQDWSYGIGTGLGGLSYDGDVGFATASGPVTFDLDLDTDDTRELLKSGIGFGGYAKKDKLTISYALGKLEFDDRASDIGVDGLGQLDEPCLQSRKCVR